MPKRRPCHARAGVFGSKAFGNYRYCTVKLVVALPEIPLMVPVAFAS